MAKGGRVTAKGCNDVILWQSSDPSVATVDQNGKVRTGSGKSKSVKITVG